MFAATKQLIAKQSGLTPVQPDEFHDDFTTKSTTSLNSAGIQAFTSDSGHAYYWTGTVAGAFKASPKDGTMVYTLSATSGVGASYLCASLGGIVYGWCRMRFVQGGQSTHNSAGGLIPWNNITPNSAASSGAHCVITENELYFQEVVNGGGFTTLGGGGGTWGYTDPVEAWFEVEWAIYGDDLVVRLPNGTTHTYTDTSLVTYLGNWLCAEPVRNSSTDWTPEFAEMKGSTLAGMNEAQLAYYNNLLAAEGIGPASAPAALASGSPVLVAVGGATVGTAGNPNPAFKKVSDGTNYTCVAGDYIVMAAFNDDTQGLTVAPSGYGTITSVQNGASCSLTVFEKTAAGGETSTGAPASGTQADGAIALVFSSCGGNGATNTAAAQTAIHTIPVLSPLTNSPAGKSRKLFLFGRRDDTVTNLGIDAPVGFDVAKLQEDDSVSGNNSVLGAYLSASNVTADAAASFSDAAGEQYDARISIELLGV